MREMKRGELTSGRSGKKVRDPKQAIAIGLSEARRSGAKVPSAGGSGARGRKQRGSPSSSSRKTHQSSRKSRAATTRR
jgi:hypothetical protein